MSSIELLAPAGDFQKMQFALAYGADAVYLGIPRFSLRARENQFRTIEDIYRAIDYAHRRGKKIYVTANIFPHNRKLQPFLNFIDSFLENCQPDAWIVSDPGIILSFREKYTDQILHLSVQANTVNYLTVKFWEKIGIKRIILSRELSIKEIKEIRDHCPNIELEAFVHGAICIAYSGRCLISNYLASRDPNQGTCTNSCRWQYRLYEKSAIQPDYISQSKTEKTFTQNGDEYSYLESEYFLEETERRKGIFMPIDEDENGTYLMNARDLCAIEYLDELRDAGVNSVKIEGRTKSIYYLATVTRAYRQALNDLFAGRPFDRKLLQEIFATANRGFTAGFLKGNPGFTAQKYDSASSESTTYRFSAIVQNFDAEKQLLEISPRNKISVGMNLEILTPEKIVPLKVDRLYDRKMREIGSVSGGAENIFIPFPENPGDFCLLREPVAPQNNQQENSL